MLTLAQDAALTPAQRRELDERNSRLPAHLRTHTTIAEVDPDDTVEGIASHLEHGSRRPAPVDPVAAASAKTPRQRFDTTGYVRASVAAESPRGRGSSGAPDPRAQTVRDAHDSILRVMQGRTYRLLNSMKQVDGDRDG